MQSGRCWSSAWIGPPRSGFSARAAWASANKLGAFGGILGVFRRGQQRLAILLEDVRVLDLFLGGGDGLGHFRDERRRGRSLRTQRSRWFCGMPAGVRHSGAGPRLTRCARVVTSAGSSVVSVARRRNDSIRDWRSSADRWGVGGRWARACSRCSSKLARRVASMPALVVFSSWGLFEDQVAGGAGLFGIGVEQRAGFLRAAQVAGTLAVEFGDSRRG